MTSGRPVAVRPYIQRAVWNANGQQSDEQQRPQKRVCPTHTSRVETDVEQRDGQ